MHALNQSLLAISLAGLAASIVGCVTRPIVVTAKPRFEQKGKFVDLVVADAEVNRSYDISWGMPPDVRFVPVSLDTNRVYTFTVVEKPFHSIRIPELQRVEADGLVIYDVEVCEVHKTKMDHKKVRIAYGLILPGPGAPSADTERRYFPHFREHSFGGCVITPDSPKTERIYVCPECKKAYEEWRADKNGGG